MLSLVGMQLKPAILFPGGVSRGFSHDLYFHGVEETASVP